MGNADGFDFDLVPAESEDVIFQRSYISVCEMVTELEEDFRKLGDTRTQAEIFGQFDELEARDHLLLFLVPANSVKVACGVLHVRVLECNKAGMSFVQAVETAWNEHLAYWKALEAEAAADGDSLEALVNCKRETARLKGEKAARAAHKAWFARMCKAEEDVWDVLPNSDPETVPGAVAALAVNLIANGDNRPVADVVKHVSALEARDHRLARTAPNERWALGAEIAGQAHNQKASKWSWAGYLDQMWNRAPGPYRREDGIYF
jgi:hypothetical protein